MHDATRTTESPQCQPTFRHQSLVTRVSPKWSSIRRQIIWLYKSYQTNIVTTISDSYHLQYFSRQQFYDNFLFSGLPSLWLRREETLRVFSLQAPRGLLQVILKPLEGYFKWYSSLLRALQVTFKWPSRPLRVLQVTFKYVWAIWGKLWKEKEGIFVKLVWSFFTNNAVLAHEVCIFSKN